MKKTGISFLAVLLMFTFVFVLAGCGHDNTPGDSPRVVDVTPPPADDGGTDPIVETYLLADYIPLVEGNYWRYLLTMSYIEQETVTVNGRVVDSRTESGDIDEEEEYSVFAAFDEESDRYLLYINIDWNNTAFMLTVDEQGLTLYGVSEEEGDGEALFVPPLNILPGEVEVGTEQTFSSAIGEEGPTISGTAAVEGLEEITVPVGTFDTLKIVILLDNPEMYAGANFAGEEGGCSFVIRNTIWLADGIGAVKMETRSVDSCTRVETGTGYITEYMYTSMQIMTSVLTEYENGPLQ